MIKLIQDGQYALIETGAQTKILTLDDKDTFAWVNAADIGEILVASHKKHITDNVLAMGKYRMYEVKDEPQLTDLTHLEFFVGDGKWQGYLLPKGLPTNEEKRHRVIPTKETITRSTH